MKFEPGDLIDDRYRVVSVLGRGSSGTLYLAEDQLLARQTAIKILNRSADGHRLENEGRFEREAKVLSSLDDPNVVSIRRYGFLADGCPFLVLDYIEGRTLRDLLNEEKSLTVSMSVEIALQICKGLRAAQERNIIHRDIKPENILITQKDAKTLEVRVIDFGLCKDTLDDTSDGRLTRTGTVLGSPLYMSPEQCQQMPSDWRADVYSFGCVFFEMLKGQAPFSGDSAIELMNRHVNQALPELCPFTKNDECSQLLDKIIQSCTKKNPAQRYASIEDVIGDLSALSKLQIDRRLVLSSEDIGKTRKTNLLSIIASVVILVALAGGTALWINSTTAVAPIGQSSSAKVLAEVENLVKVGHGLEAESVASTYFASDDWKRRTGLGTLSTAIQRRIFCHDLFVLLKNRKSKFSNDLAIRSLEEMRNELVIRRDNVDAQTRSQLSPMLEELSTFLLQVTRSPRDWSKLLMLLRERARFDQGEYNQVFALISGYACPNFYILRGHANINAQGTLTQERSEEAASEFAFACKVYILECFTKANPESVRSATLKKLRDTAELIMLEQKKFVNKWSEYYAHIAFGLCYLAEGKLTEAEAQYRQSKLCATNLDVEEDETMFMTVFEKQLILSRKK